MRQNKSQKNGKQGNIKFSHNDKTRNNMVQLRNRNRNSINLQILYFRNGVPTPECNFLHGFFRCKLPVEVVDVEVKITSMQGMHIFRRDRMAQLIKCTPLEHENLPAPYYY